MKLQQEMSEFETRLVMENIKLVPYLAGRKLGIPYDSPYYNDVLEAGLVGLNQAARFFKPELKISFTTYASKCIVNEMLMFLRQVKRYKREVSFNEPIYEQDHELNVLTRGDVIADKRDFYGEIESKDQLINTINAILNMSTMSKLVLLYKMGNITQKQIGKQLRKSQSYISRLQKDSGKQLAEQLQNGITDMVHTDTAWSFEIIKDKFYRFIYKTKDEEDYRKAWKVFDSVRIECSIDFEKYNYVAIQFFIDDDAFAVIAEIIRKMELGW